MMGVQLEFGGDVVLDGTLHHLDVFSGRNQRAVADTVDMRVDGLRGHPPPHVEDHVGGLAAHPRQRLQRGAGRGDRAAVVVHQDLA